MIHEFVMKMPRAVLSLSLVGRIEISVLSATRALIFKFKKNIEHTPLLGRFPYKETIT